MLLSVARSTVTASARWPGSATRLPIACRAAVVPAIDRTSR